MTSLISHNVTNVPSKANKRTYLGNVLKDL